MIIADAYCLAVGLSRSRVSTIAFNGGAVLDRVADGGDITTGNFERGVKWFSDNWPAATPWPDGIARPEKREAA